MAEEKKIQKEPFFEWIEKTIDAGVDSAALKNPDSPAAKHPEAMKTLLKGTAQYAVERYLQRLWHDAAEVPEERRDLLVHCTPEGDDDYCTDWFSVASILSWPERCKAYGYVKWCYVSDLLPEGGEK